MANTQPHRGSSVETAKNSSVISMRRVTKNFPGETALSDVTMHVPQGLIFGLIGPSGSGKTTAVRLLTGVYEPDSGSIEVFGLAPTEFGEQSRRRIGYMPQQFALYDELSVKDNLNFAASVYGVSPFHRTSIDELLDLVELTGHQKKRARKLSGGMRRRLALAASLAHEPKLAFLDEPTAGIDPVLRRKFWEYFEVLKSKGTSLFITTQYVDEATNCDIVAVLRNGRLLAMDTPGGLRDLVSGSGVVAITLREPLSPQQLESLRALPVSSGVVTNPEGKEIRITVEDPEQAMPSIMNWFSEHRPGIQRLATEIASMEDIFVQLMDEEQVR